MLLLQVSNSVPNPPRRDDRSGGGMNSNQDRRRGKGMQEDSSGWMTPSRNRQINVDGLKLKSKAVCGGLYKKINEMLSFCVFAAWSFRSAGDSQPVL